MNQGSVEVVVAIPWTIVAILIAAAVFISFWIYRDTIPPVSIMRRRFLATLRAVSLSLVVFLLSAPMLVTTTERRIKPQLPVLVDRSQSMGLKDALGNRSEIVRELLSKRIPPSWSDSLEIIPLSFSEETGPLGRPDSLQFDGPGSDLASALEHVRKKFGREGIAGALLISDGQYNLGRHPASVARGIGFPIYSVGVGDPAEPRDIWIDQVVSNDVVYAGLVANIRAYIAGSGFAGTQLEVQLVQDGKIVARKLIEIGEQGSLSRVDFDVQPTQPGVTRFSIRAVPLAGEFTVANNERTLAIKVLKSRTKVLLVSGAPGPDHAVLHKILSEDQSVTVSSQVQRRDGSFLQIDPAGRDTDDPFDVVLFCRFPTAFTTQAELDRFSGILNRNSLPAGFFLGPEVDFEKLNALHQELPVRFEFDDRLTEEAVPIQTTIVGRNSTLLLIADDFSETERQWSEVPPVWISKFVLRPAEVGEVLIRADLARMSNVWRLKKDVPLVVAGKHLKKKTLVVAAYGLWKTHFVMQALNRNNEAFRTFIQNSIRWLALTEDLRPFIIQTGKPIYRQHERMTITAQLYDDNLRTISDGLIKVDVIHGTSKQTTELKPLGNGRYETQVALRDTGTVRLVAEAFRGGESAGTERSMIYVEPYSIELAKVGLNEEVMKSVATESGGAYVAEKSFEQLAGAVSLKSKTVKETSEINLWSHPLFLFLVVACLAAEWFVRKRSDMM